MTTWTDSIILHIRDPFSTTSDGKPQEQSYVGSNPTPPTNLMEGSEVVKRSGAKKGDPEVQKGKVMSRQTGVSLV